MSQSYSKAPRRQADGSIDTAHYLAIGRQQRSRQGIHLLVWINAMVDRIWAMLMRDVKNKGDVRLHFKG